MKNAENLQRNIDSFLEQKLDGFAETLADFLAKSVAEQQAERNEFQNVFSFGKKSTNPNIAEYKEQIKPELSNFIAAFLKGHQYIREEELHDDTYEALKDAKNNAEIALIQKCKAVFPETFVSMQSANFSNIIGFEWGKFRLELLAEKNGDIDNFLEVYGKLFYADGLLHNHAKDTLQIDVLKELGFQQEVIYQIAGKSFEEAKSELRRPPQDSFYTDVLSAWDIWNFYKQEKGREVDVAELI